MTRIKISTLCSVSTINIFISPTWFVSLILLFFGSKSPTPCCTKCRRAFVALTWFLYIYGEKIKLCFPHFVPPPPHFVLCSLFLLCLSSRGALAVQMTFTKSPFATICRINAHLMCGNDKCVFAVAKFIVILFYYYFTPCPDKYDHKSTCEYVHSCVCVLRECKNPLHTSHSRYVFENVVRFD